MYKDISSKLAYDKQFIDDVYGFWQNDNNLLQHCLSQYVFNLHHHIKITTCISKQSVDFLDVTISINEDLHITMKLCISCLQKQLYLYQYLPFTSNNPHHPKVHS